MSNDMSVNCNIVTQLQSYNHCVFPFFFLAEDGRLKYKVHFEPKGKSLVSAHHIALDCPPQLDQLLVGTRVVVRFPRDQQNFCPGVMAELPDKRNKLRFVCSLDNRLSLKSV